MSAEPSMEEILSSIKRIIAEEGEAPVRARRAPRVAPAAAPLVIDDADEDEDDSGAGVLELRDPIPPVRMTPETFASRMAARAEPVALETSDAPGDDPVVEPLSAVEPMVMPAPAVEATASARPAAPRADEAEPILSARAAEASRSSLDNLSRLLVRNDAASADDNTLEGLVRTMLRPMLREWLDANLPAMVEQMVASEIARITGQHGR